MNEDNHLLDPAASGSAPPPREEAILATGGGDRAQRELYGALMKGFPADERGQLEELMVDNVARLRDDGDSYAP